MNQEKIVKLQAVAPAEYLAGDEFIDLSHPSIRRLAGSLRAEHPDDESFARAAFEYARDGVRHSWDVQDPRVTLSASETLREGVGLCFAKAHLLTALLRAERIPAGLCYQRLTDDGSTFTVHGLVAVHLQGNWHRQDPRGNKTLLTRRKCELKPIVEQRGAGQPVWVSTP
jgi:transglutaminase-like putative cysteine protease